jgi:hypothetical protein
MAAATCAVGYVKGAVAIGLLYPTYLPSNDIQRFFPGYALKFPATAFPNALHRIFQPVGMVLAAQVRTPAHTSPQLRVCDTVGTVVGFQLGDYAIFDMGD